MNLARRALRRASHRPIVVADTNDPQVGTDELDLCQASGKRAAIWAR